MIDSKDNKGPMEAYFGIAIFLLFSITAAQAAWSVIRFVNEQASGELTYSPSLFGLAGIILAIAIIAVEVEFNLTGKGVFPTISAVVIAICMALPWLGGFFPLTLNNGPSPVLGVIPGAVFLGRFFGYSKWNESRREKGKAGVPKPVVIAELAGMALALIVAVALLATGLGNSTVFWIIALALPFYLISWLMSVYGMREDRDLSKPCDTPTPDRSDGANGN